MNRVVIICGVALLSAISFAGEAQTEKLKASPKLVIAHHMNAALPAKAGGQDPLAHGSNTPTYRSESSDYGGRVRDMSITNLYDFPHRQSMQEQIAWEVKVAQRSGVDAFAFYGTLPGRKAQLLEYMKAAKGTGFKLTLCQSGGERGSKYEEAMEALKDIVEADRGMDTLLRVDGKLLLLTYGGNWGDSVEAMLAKRKDMEKRVGTPMWVMYCPFPLTTAGHIRNNPEKIAALYEAEKLKLTTLLEGGFDGLSPFAVVPDERTEADCRFWMELCIVLGKQYYQPVAFQFHSSKYMTHAPVGDRMWNRSWNIANDGADGVQLVTWNDWGEATAMAPGIKVNYGLCRLLSQQAQRFKAGNQLINEEKAWVMYYSYPSTAIPRLFPQRVLHWETREPRQFRFAEHDYIWVRTELNAPATIRCEGRGEKAVAAGVQLTAFPLTTGPVRVTLHRGGETIKTLSPPEVVSDTPWRVDHAMVIYGDDEDERTLRLLDFPDQAPRSYSEYGDDDSDGLLNWFEGLYFSVLEFPVTPVSGEDAFNGMSCKEAQERMLSPLKRDIPVELKAPVNVDIKSGSKQFIGSIWKQRYHWNRAGLRDLADGMAIVNMEDRGKYEIFAFYDTVPNPTYGPNCLYGDVNVTADIQFNCGTQAISQWGAPEFALLSRVSPGRESMVYFKVAVDGSHTAKLSLGWSQRKKWSPIQGAIIAEKTIPIPENGAFKLSLKASTLDDGKVHLTGVCQWADGANPTVLTAEHSALQASGMTTHGEVGFSAKIPPEAASLESPNVLLKQFQIAPVVR